MFKTLKKVTYLYFLFNAYYFTVVYDIFSVPQNSAREIRVNFFPY